MKKLKKPVADMVAEARGRIEEISTDALMKCHGALLTGTIGESI